MSELRINISKLSEGVHDYTLETESSAIGLDERFSRKVFVKASIEKSTRQMFLQVKLATEGSFLCDRCLEGFLQNLTGRYSIVYLINGHAGTNLEKKEEVQVLSPDTNYVDLDEDVRQVLTLAVPQKLLCKDDCAGLCPTCGKNKNNSRCYCESEKTDPRWEGLQKIFRN